MILSTYINNVLRILYIKPDNGNIQFLKGYTTYIQHDSIFTSKHQRRVTSGYLRQQI